jgi:hypothetical protein
MGPAVTVAGDAPLLSGANIIGSDGPALTGRSGHWSEEEAYAQRCPCAVR